MTDSTTQPIGGHRKYPAFDSLFESTISQRTDDFVAFEKVFVIVNKAIPCGYLFGLFKKIIANRQVEQVERLISLIEYGVKQSTNDFRVHCTEQQFLESWHGLIIYMPSHVSRKILCLVLFLKNSLKFFTNEVRNVENLHRVLVAEGYTFPHFDAGSSYVVPKEEISAEPTWLEGDWCALCGMLFTGIKRKHHCRKCGNVVCGSCSANKSTIPIYNILSEVRVCNKCHSGLQSNPINSDACCNATTTTTQPHQCNLLEIVKEYAENDDATFYYEEDMKKAMQNSLADSQRNQGVARPTDDTSDTYFQEDLKKAIELSLAESNKNNPYNATPRSDPVPSKSAFSTTATTTSTVSKYPDLKPQPSSSTALHKYEREPSEIVYPSQATSSAYHCNFKLPPQVDNQQQSVESMLAFFYKTISMFEQRCNVLRSSNQPFSKDYYLQGILQTLLVSHVQVFEILSLNNKEIDELNVQLSKLDLIKEARSTLEDLNREHMEKLRQQKEEADMFLRIQMEQKMELTRQQKKEVEDIQKSLQNKLRINIDSKLNNYGQPTSRRPSINDDNNGPTRQHFPSPTHPMVPSSTPVYRSEHPLPNPPAFTPDQPPVVYYHHPLPHDIPFYAGQNVTHFYAYPPGETTVPMGPVPNPHHQVRPPLNSQNQNNSQQRVGNYVTPNAAENSGNFYSSNVMAYPENLFSNPTENSTNNNNIMPLQPQASQQFDQTTNEAPTHDDHNDPKSKLIDFDP